MPRNIEETRLNSLYGHIIPSQIATGKGSIYTKLYSQDIIVVECEGEIKECSFNTLRKGLLEYHYKSLIQNIRHHTFVILDLSLVTTFDPLLFNDIPFITAVIQPKENKKKVRHIGKFVSQVTSTFDEALLFVLLVKKQYELVQKTDYYAVFIDRWFNDTGRRLINNYRIISDPSWQVAGEKPKMVANIDVIEGNLFKLTINGFLDNFSVERIIFLIKKVCVDLAIDNKCQPIVLIIDSKGVVGFSLRISGFMGSMIKREINARMVYLLPSAIVKTYHRLIQHIRTDVYQNWVLINDIETAVERAIGMQIVSNNEDENQKALAFRRSEKQPKPVFDEMFDVFRPLIQGLSSERDTEMIENPATIGQYISNLVSNMMQNIACENQSSFDFPFKFPLSFINTLRQAVLLCHDSRIVLANDYCEVVWGYRASLLNNQPLAVLIDLSTVHAIMKLNDNETISDLTTYHAKGYTVSLSCTRINTDENYYYLSFYFQK